MDEKKTLTLSWNDRINQSLRQLWKNNPEKNVILAGVGNTLMGDDAAGILVVQHLKTILPAESRFIPVDCGPTPENFTGLIRRAQPGLVFFIDAGDMNEPPGSVGLYACDQAEGVSAFGHSLPLSVLGQYLEKELNCACFLLIIQPGMIDYDVPVTDDVQKTVMAVCEGWLKLAKEA